MMMRQRGLGKWIRGRDPLDYEETKASLSARRTIGLVERIGWPFFLVEICLPQFDGPRALLTWPLFRPSLHVWMFFYLLAIRVILSVRIGTGLVRLAAFAGALLLAAAVAEWLLFTPALQGLSRYDGVQQVLVISARDGALDLQLEDGARVRAKNDWATHYGIRPGQCRQIEIMHGRLGVRWMEFYPQLFCIWQNGARAAGANHS